MLGEFQKSLVNILGIILIICLVIFFIMILYINREQKFPPVIGDCPDYWLSSKYFDNKDNLDMIEDVLTKTELENNEGGSKCVNVKKLGNPNCSKIMDFNEVPFNTVNGLCDKYKWAKDCDLTWDGITNNKTICDKK